MCTHALSHYNYRHMQCKHVHGHKLVVHIKIQVALSLRQTSNYGIIEIMKPGTLVHESLENVKKFCDLEIVVVNKRHQPHVT